MSQFKDMLKHLRESRKMSQDELAREPGVSTSSIGMYVLITTEMASTGDYFGLRIKGDSMEPLISDGDTVIVRKQSNADHGDIVIASIDKEDAVCKKFLKRANSITLLSVNSKYEPMEFNTRVKRSVSIIGKVVELRRSFV